MTKLNLNASKLNLLLQFGSLLLRYMIFAIFLHFATTHTYLIGSKSKWSCLNLIRPVQGRLVPLSLAHISVTELVSFIRRSSGCGFGSFSVPKVLEQNCNGQRHRLVSVSVHPFNRISTESGCHITIRSECQSVTRGRCLSPASKGSSSASVRRLCVRSTLSRTGLANPKRVSE